MLPVSEILYSVVIPTCNRTDLLHRALDSVVRQTHSPSQIIVVVDEPEDRAKYSFLQKYKPEIELYFAGGGQGPSAVRNIGMDQVRHGFLFFIDDDDEWMEMKIEKQLLFLKDHPDHIGVTCWHTVIQKNGEPREKRMDEKDIHKSWFLANIIGSPSFFGYRFDDRTKDIRFDKRLWSSEDQDLYYQLKDHGPIGVVTEPLVNYYEHAGGQLSRQDENLLKALLLFQEKYGSTMNTNEAHVLQARIHLLKAGFSKNAIGWRWHLWKYHQLNKKAEPAWRPSREKMIREIKRTKHRRKKWLRESS